MVVVDDGSPDNSADIARRFARKDARIKLVSQPNGGLGAARNFGVSHATGELLTFLDSDDELPQDAWTSMVASIDATGSDIAIGKLERDDGKRRWAMPQMEANHRVERLGITVAEMPEILADVFSVNKVYRRSFWDEAGLSFPTRIRYEDQPVLTKALLAARAVDVLTETVYFWRVREDGSSITQNRHHLADLTDRLATKRTSVAEVLAAGDAQVTRVFMETVLPVDMWEYFRSVPGCSDDYWELLVDGVRELWNDQTVPFERTAVPPQQRLMGWFVAQGRRDDLVALLEWIDTHRPLPFEDDLLAHPWRDEPGLPGLAR